MESGTITTVDRSLHRCFARRDFLDLFYKKFLASSVKVQAKFAQTDFDRQKRALRASLYLILLAADDEKSGPDRYLSYIAERHGASQLDIGADLYDLWFDSLLETVKECDPEFDDTVSDAWEQVMMVGIRYLIERYRK